MSDLKYNKEVKERRGWVKEKVVFLNEAAAAALNAQEEISGIRYSLIEKENELPTDSEKVTEAKEKLLAINFSVKEELKYHDILSVLMILDEAPEVKDSENVFATAEALQAEFKESN